MKDWESRNQGADNPLDFVKNPIPAHLVKKTDVSQVLRSWLLTCPRAL